MPAALREAHTKRWREHVAAAAQTAADIPSPSPARGAGGGALWNLGDAAYPLSPENLLLFAGRRGFQSLGDELLGKAAESVYVPDPGPESLGRLTAALATCDEKRPGHQLMIMCCCYVFVPCARLPGICG